MPLPESVAEYCDWIATRTILGGCEGSPFDYGRTQETEELRADVPGRNLLGFCAIGEVRAAKSRCRDVVERAGVLLPQIELRRRHPWHPSPVKCVPQDNEPVGVRVRRRSEEYGVDHGKDRRVRTNG